MKTLLFHSIDINSDEDEWILTMVDPLYGDCGSSHQFDCDADTGHIIGAGEASAVTAEVRPQNASGQQEELGGSRSAEKNKDEVLKKLENAFAQLTSVEDLETFLELHSRMRVMVSIEKVLELSTDTCTMGIEGKVCGEGLQLTQDVKNIGSRVEILSKCKNRHSKKCVSSEVLVVKDNAEFYLNDSLFAAAIIISRNNYSKFALLCYALGLTFISSNTFT